MANLNANIVSTLQAGCFFGALSSSFVADKLGRRPALMVAAFIAFIGSLMQAAANGHLAVMYIGRYVISLWSKLF
jgi:MFS family permease